MPHNGFSVIISTDRSVHALYALIEPSRPLRFNAETHTTSGTTYKSFFEVNIFTSVVIVHILMSISRSRNIHKKFVKAEAVRKSKTS